MSDYKSQENIGISDKFGERLRLYRKKLGKSQAEFSEELQVSLSSVTRMERNVFKPQGDFLARLVNVYNCDVGSMLSRKGEDESSEGKPVNIIRDPHIYAFLKAQLDGLLEMIDAITDKENNGEVVGGLQCKVEYLNALLLIGNETKSI